MPFRQSRYIYLLGTSTCRHPPPAAPEPLLKRRRNISYHSRGEGPCYLLDVRRWIPHEWSLWGNREKEFVLASLICFWTTKLLFQNSTVRFKVPTKVVPGRVFQVPGLSCISQDGLGFFVVTNNTPHFNA